MNNTLIVEGHPCLVTEEIAARNGRDLTFTYSRYRVAPPGLQAVAPRSAVLKVAAQDVTQEWLVERVAELGPDEEMALHSLVESKRGVFHIPMIDFIGHPAKKLVSEISRMVKREMGLTSRLILFDTGRSFHGYFPDLIAVETWSRYLGELLLFTEPDESPVIDTRWVGHALVRGFTALRWSHNTNRYLAMPRLASVYSAHAR